MHKKESYDSILFEKTVIGLALCRMNGELIDVNTAYASLIGRTVEEVFTLSYWQITPEKYTQQEQEQLDSLEKTGKYGPYEKEYIHKDGHLVPVRLSGQIVEIDGEPYIWSSVEDITERKKAEEEIQRLYKEAEKLAVQDGLTGIANRRMIDQTLEREWSRAQRDQLPLSLIMVDIDQFKEFNDYYGHLKGDDCLKQVACALSGVPKRAIDLVGRYGGEEFIVLLPETDEAQAIQLAEQCLNAVRQLCLLHERSQVSDVVTISIGVASITPSTEDQLAALIERADHFLYQAKANGRDRVASER